MTANQLQSGIRRNAPPGIKQIFTRFNNPKGNAESQRMMRLMKEKLIWTNEFKSVEQLRSALHRWIKDYNVNYLYSALE